MALNVFDLLVSLLHVPIVVIWFCKGDLCGGDSPLFVSLLAFTDSTVGCSAFITCLLSLTRTISLLSPFYQIHKKALGLAGLVFLLQEVVRILLWFYFFYFRSLAELYLYYHLHFSILFGSLNVVIVVNVASSALSSWKLLRARRMSRVSSGAAGGQMSGDKNNRRATVTILLVTVQSVILNSLFCVSLALSFYLGTNVTSANLSSCTKSIYMFSIWLSVPLNSAINPLIYLARKREMRRHLQNSLLSFC